jgi:hypothetical protein
VVDPKIVVALIAVAGVVTQVVVTYLINRQSANDLRTNIAREIDIIQKLRPDSSEAMTLEGHVRKSIRELIARDERRDLISSIIATFGPLPLIGLVLWGLRVWGQHGIPKDLVVPVQIIAGFLVGFGIGAAFLLAWQVLRLFYLISQLSLSYVQLWWVQVKTWWSVRVKTRWLNRKRVKLERHIEELKPKFFARREYDRKVMDVMMSRKDELIEERGQEWWDKLMASREEHDRQGAEIEARWFKAREDELAESEEPAEDSRGPS